MENESGFLCCAVFPVPSAIVTDLPLQTSERAKEMLRAALALCERRRPGVVFSQVNEDELQALVTDCHALSANHSAHSDTTHLLNDDEQSFDRFFGIARCGSPDAFAIGTVWGLIAMMHEVRRSHTLIPAELSALVSGFYRLAEAFLPTITSERGLVADAGDEAPCPPSRPPIERWKNGHLTFVALTCGLIFAHVRTIAAIENRNAAEAIAALRDTSCLFAASAAAMHLAGDLTPEEYQGVRVHMSPPHVPEGFSGLFNADHRCLLNVTKKLGTLLQQEWQEISWAREEYWRALNDAYSAHRWVCQKLVNESPSLASLSRSPQQPGPEKLERFARRALLFSGYAKRGSHERRLRARRCTDSKKI